MIFAALVSHGQDMTGTPAAELIAAAGFVLSTIAAALVRARILKTKGAGQL